MLYVIAPSITYAGHPPAREARAQDNEGLAPNTDKRPNYFDCTIFSAPVRLLSYSNTPTNSIASSVVVDPCFDITIVTVAGLNFYTIAFNCCMIYVALSI
jgi:hypothetical protein